MQNNDGEDEEVFKYKYNKNITLYNLLEWFK